MLLVQLKLYGNSIRRSDVDPQPPMTSSLLKGIVCTIACYVGIWYVHHNSRPQVQQIVTWHLSDVDNDEHMGCFKSSSLSRQGASALTGKPWPYASADPRPFPSSSQMDGTAGVQELTLEDSKRPNSS